jgi:hypothetical protein
MPSCVYIVDETVLYCFKVLVLYSPLRKILGQNGHCFGGNSNLVRPSNTTENLLLQLICMSFVADFINTVSSCIALKRIKYEVNECKANVVPVHAMKPYEGVNV